jgi:hypothetical protein
MSRCLRWFAHTAIWGLCVLSLAACERETCPDRLRLDDLLGGGIPICLGGSWSQVGEYAEQGEFDSLGWFSINAGGRYYLYTPGGGLDLVIARPFAKIGRACVSLGSQPGSAAHLRRRAMARLGGEWRQIAAPQGMTEWLSSEGWIVSFRDETGFCVSTRYRKPVPNT